MFSTFFQSDFNGRPRSAGPALFVAVAAGIVAAACIAVGGTLGAEVVVAAAALVAAGALAIAVSRVVSRNRELLALVLESEEMVCQVTESVRGHAIFTLDAGGDISSWNHGAADLFDRESDAAVGTDLQTLFAADDAGVAEMMRLALSDGMATSEFVLARGENTFEGEVSISSRLDDSGDAVGYVAVVRDLTTERKLAAALRAQAAQAELLAVATAQAAAARREVLVERSARQVNEGRFDGNGEARDWQVPGRRPQATAWQPAGEPKGHPGRDGDRAFIAPREGQAASLMAAMIEADRTDSVDLLTPARSR